MSVGTRAEATLDPVTMSIVYVVANTQIRYIMVLTRLRVAVSYIILVIMPNGFWAGKKYSAKKIAPVLTVIVGSFLRVELVLQAAQGSA